MKNNYQKIKIVFLSIMLISIIDKSNAQQIPTGAPSGTITPWNPANSSFAWFRGGNTATVTGGLSNNIFGTFWDSPIYTYTDSAFRQVILGSITSGTTNAAGTIAKDGFMGINTQDPWSRLHIVNGTYGACGGYRPWMREGLNIQTNDDQFWFGHKSFGNPDQQNAVINWSDDPGISGSGPDHLVINFTSTSASLATYPVQGVNPNPQTLAGREMMRFIDNGNVGIGPRFDNTFTPQSTLHQHQQNDASSWMQISNQYMTTTGGNANTAATLVNTTDGLRWGILGSTVLNENGNAFIYNQEQRHLIFSTGNQTPTSITNTAERFRITAVQNPTELPGGGYGNYNPWGVVGRITRTSISRDPNQPVVRPMTMQHLGYDYGNAGTFGWRNWMDIGTMYLSNSNDHMYVGLKQETAGQNDAVVSWGKNANAGAYERLRFIFSSNVGNSAGANGLEVTRMWSDGNEGRMGVGDFFTLGIEPQNTVHINSTALNDQTVGGSSGLRFQDLTSNTPPTLVNPGNGVLSVDVNGDVIYVTDGGTGIGNYCSAPVQNPLTDHYEIPMNNFNYFFSGAGVPNTSSVAVGVPCGTFLPAKFNVYQNAGVTVGTNTGATAFLNQDICNVPFLILRGSYSETNGIQTLTKTTNVGGEFRASNADANIGVRVRNIANNIIAASSSSVAGDFLSDGAYSQNVGVTAQASNGTGSNNALQAIAYSINPSNQNMAGYFNAFGANLNYGIYASVNTNDPIPSTFPPTSGNYAGYFNGSVIRTESDNFTSDVNLKTNIDSLENALDIIEILAPKTFFYDTTNTHGMVFSSKKQFGFIAQDVEQILPEIVGTATQPVIYDSLGNVVTQSYTYKTLQYQSFIAILTKGVQELNSENEELQNKLNEQDSINTALQDQINTLYSMITSCCSNNSNTENNSINQNPTLDVTLSDNVPSIVLDQNVPNPFAEQTTITYTLTDGVKKAQMLFYNIEGKLIQAVELSNASGKGQMNVFANDLSTGVYTYTLVVDGEIKGTKRMVKN